MIFDGVFFSRFVAVELMTMNVEQPLEQSHNNLFGQRFQRPHLFGLNDCFVPIFFALVYSFPSIKKMCNKFKLWATF